MLGVDVCMILVVGWFSQPRLTTCKVGGGGGISARGGDCALGGRVVVLPMSVNVKVPFFNFLIFSINMGFCNELAPFLVLFFYCQI